MHYEDEEQEVVIVGCEIRCGDVDKTARVDVEPRCLFLMASSKCQWHVHHMSIVKLMTLVGRESVE